MMSKAGAYLFSQQTQTGAWTRYDYYNPEASATVTPVKFTVQ